MWAKRQGTAEGNLGLLRDLESVGRVRAKVPDLPALRERLTCMVWGFGGLGGGWWWWWGDSE